MIHQPDFTYRLSSGGSVAQPAASRVRFGDALLKKTRCTSDTGLSLVAFTFEISNLILNRDLKKVFCSLST